MQNHMQWVKIMLLFAVCVRQLQFHCPQFYTLFSLSSASKPNKPHYISHAQCGIFVYHIKYSIGFTPYLQEVKQALPHLKPGYKLEISVFSGENTLHSLQDPLSEREMMSI